jgi:hypothetical protein
MDLKPFVRPDFPVERLSFWRGFDLFGSIMGRNRVAFSPQSDEEAIAQDWAVVGRDLQSAIERFAAK